MTSKQKLLRLRDEVIAERIEQRKEKIRLIEKHNITVVPNNRCIRICMSNTVFDILLLSYEGRAVKSRIVFCTEDCFLLLIYNNRRCYHVDINGCSGICFYASLYKER